MSNVVTQLTSLPLQSAVERYAMTHITAVWGIALILATRCKRSFRDVASQGEAIFHDDADRPGVSAYARSSVSQNGVASACLLPDEQSFSSGDGRARATLKNIPGQYFRRFRPATFD